MEEKGEQQARRTATCPVPDSESSNWALRQTEAMPIKEKGLAWRASVADKL